MKKGVNRGYKLIIIKEGKKNVSSRTRYDIRTTQAVMLENHLGYFSIRGVDRDLKVLNEDSR
jgi:hypothetical protein